FARRPAPPGWRFAPGPSIRAPASGWPDCRKPPVVHIPQQSAEASIHLHTRPLELRLRRRQEPDARSASARVPSRPAPYRGHGSPASYEIPPSTLLRATSDPLPDALFPADPGNWIVPSSAAAPLPLL